MNDTPDVVVAGHVCLDVIPSFSPAAGALDALLVPGKLVEVGPPVVSTGGAVSNAGMALHRLGVRTRLVGKVGGDLFGQAILDLFRRTDPALAGHMVVAPAETTSYTLVINPPGVDRVFLHCPGANDRFHPDEVPSAALAGARVLHFGYPPLMQQTYADGGKALAEFFQRVRASGVTVSMDMARPDPASPAGRVDWAAWLGTVLPHVDLFGPSLEEILFMLDGPDADLDTPVTGGLLRRIGDGLLERGAAVVVVKLGDSGLYLRTSPDLGRVPAWRVQPDLAGAWAGRELFGPCFSVSEVGTTGSGDCTLAGFIAAILRDQRPEDALLSALGTGACSVEAADAASGVPRWADVQQRIRVGWPQRPHHADLTGWTPHPSGLIWRGPSDASEGW